MSHDAYVERMEGIDNLIEDAIHQFFSSDGDELEPMILDISKEVFDMAEITSGYGHEYDHYRKLILKNIIISATKLMYTWKV